MEWFEPLIAIGALAFVGLVIFFHFYNKKKGKSLTGCNGNCNACSGSCHNNYKKLLDEYHKVNN